MAGYRTHLRKVVVSVVCDRDPRRIAVDDSVTAAAYVRAASTIDWSREHFGVLCRDVRGRALGVEVLSIGSLDTTIVHPREVFLAAIRHSAFSIVCWHTHPSGDLSPSDEDLEVARRLTEAGLLLGIPVVDHVIITTDGERSFMEAKRRGQGMGRG